ncbi:MAG: cyclase family protein [Lachnospiraceae bacterium]|nr:cyclase family protein [Lachnospiraceae bacterium]
MQIYDISQEVFSSKVFPGDPSPKLNRIMNISAGDVCNLTEFSMCAHNGTHVDAPKHFYDDGKAIDEIPLDHFVGYAFVTEFDGNIKAEDAKKILEKAKFEDERAAERVLIKGEAVVTEEAASVFAENGIKLFGNESQTVGPEDAPKEVHLIMLGADIVLLEGIVLDDISEGVYLLNAAPVNLGESDGAPCRALLIKE